MHRVQRQPAFASDTADAYNYLLERSPRAAQALLDQIEAVVQLLQEHPVAGLSRPELGDRLRSFPVRGYRHTIFYRVHADRIELLRLLHGARDITAALIS